MVQDIACGVKENTKGAKSCKAEVDFGTYVISVWSHSMAQQGNKSSMGKVIVVKNKCVGTPEVAVNKVGVQTCSIKRAVVCNNGVDC